MTYNRYWQGGEMTRQLAPRFVVSGEAIDIVRDARTRADDLGILLGYRQIFGGPRGIDLLSDIGAKAVPELAPFGFYILDLRIEDTRKKKWEINERLRDGLGQAGLPDLVDHGVYLLEENNSPWIADRNWTFRFPPDVLVEDLERMAEIWGSRLCVNIGGSSLDAEPLIRRAGELTGSDGEFIIQWVRQDALGRVWKTVDGVPKSTGPGESWSSQYRQRREFFGRDWLGATFEVNGISGQWPALGVNIEEAYNTFQLARGVFFGDMGGVGCKAYPGWDAFATRVAERATTAVPALTARLGRPVSNDR